jgi:adenosylcobinamide-GDP ribazoletransferase
MVWSGLRLAVSLLSVVPVRSPERTPSRREAGAAICWAPAVGLALGIAAALPLTLSHWLGPLTAAALAVTALAALTRGLHLDGLADLADGLGSGRPAAAALEIMRKSDIGPFGVTTLVLTLLIQVAALGHAASISQAAAALIAAAVTGRLAIVWACGRGVPPARAGGLGSLVAGTVPRASATGLTAAVLGVAFITSWAGLTRWTVPPAIAAGLAGSVVLRRHVLRRLGGITGDVLGALCEVAATITLLIACVA